MVKGRYAPFETQLRQRMAIYHFNAMIISRSAGRSATASIAYRAGISITDRRTGLEFDYSRRDGVEHTEILAPAHSPDWVQDRSELWNRVEEAETRKNSQVAREVRVALPDELDPEQRMALVRDFCQSQFVDVGMIADIAIHAPGREGDQRNHHAHIMLTTREIGADGFTSKNRDWNAREVLEGWREAWADAANHALEVAGVDVRIDHRTLEAQREEAYGLAAEAETLGDDAAYVQHLTQALSLDRDPLPRLTPNEWEAKREGAALGRIALWQEVSERAEQVKEIVAEFVQGARDWLGRAMDTAERVLVGGPALAVEGSATASDDFWSQVDVSKIGAVPRARDFDNPVAVRHEESARDKLDAEDRERVEREQAYAERERVRLERVAEREAHSRDDGWSL